MEALTHSRFSSVYLIGSRSISITNRPGWLFCLFQKCAVHGIPNLDVSFYKTEVSVFRKAFPIHINHVGHK